MLAVKPYHVKPVPIRDQDSETRSRPLTAYDHVYKRQLRIASILP